MKEIELQGEQAADKADHNVRQALADNVVALLFERQPKNNPDKELNEFRTRVKEQTLAEVEPGLDPIIAKGKSLTQDLDKAISKGDPNDAKTKDLISMRIEAGINLCHAYTNCFHPDGSPYFPQETLKELKEMIRLSPAVVKKEEFTELTSKTRLDADFYEKYKQAGGEGSKLHSIAPIKGGELNRILADVASGKCGAQLEETFRAGYMNGENMDPKYGGAMEISSIINPLNRELAKKRSDYRIHCAGVAERNNDGGSQLIVVARNDKEADAIMHEYLKNHAHTANTRGKLFEIKCKP